jgi:predicted AlkP superfamily phosphohydrolase/phosphomutase
VRAKLGPRDLLLVMSDHGFRQFKRGVNVNSWLWKNGYLALKPGKTSSGEWFAEVDWSRTRAYGLGLAGMYINLRGRESQGIVEPGAEADALMAELRKRLTGLRDEEMGAVAIEEMYPAREVYHGPYVSGAPDFIIGYAENYRVSWDAATGKVNDVIFEDNTKAWSADHCINPRRVPGVLFSSQPVPVEKPDIMDIAPSVLEMFGIAPPSFMDGKSMWRVHEGAARPAVPVRADAAADVVTR